MQERTRRRRRRLARGRDAGYEAVGRRLSRTRRSGWSFGDEGCCDECRGTRRMEKGDECFKGRGRACVMAGAHRLGTVQVELRRAADQTRDRPDKRDEMMARKGEHESVTSDKVIWLWCGLSVGQRGGLSNQRPGSTPAAPIHLFASTVLHGFFHSSCPLVYLSPTA